MDNPVALGATLAAGGFALVALALLAMELYVASGTFFVLTAISIYIRETRG